VTLLGTAKVLQHASPRAGVIMCAVDPHAVHPLLQELVDEHIVLCSFAGHRNHDGDAALGGTLTEYGVGVDVEEVPAFSKIDRLRGY
jgi:hypothetical protein